MADRLLQLNDVRTRLGDANYRVVLLHYGSGWTQERIARKLGVSQQSVSDRLATAARAFPGLRQARSRRIRHRPRQLNPGRI